MERSNENKIIIRGCKNPHNTINMKNLTSQEVSTLNALRDSLDETMIKAGYSVAYLTRCKTILRKIIEKNEGNIQQ